MNLKTVLFVGVIICALAVGSMFGPVIGGAATTTQPQNFFANQPNFNQNFVGSRGNGLGLGFYGLYDDIVAEELGITTTELYTLIQSGQTVEQIANEKGISTSQLVSDLVVAITAQVDQLVADNYMTDAQRTAILDNLEADVEYAIVNTGAGLGRGYMGYGTGYSMGGRGSYGFGLGYGFGYQLFDDIVANELGITTTELFTLIQSGQTIEQIANGKGISTEQLVDDLVEETTKQLDQLVEDEKITEAQRDAALETLEANITTRVQNSRVGMGQGKGGMGKAGRGMLNTDSSFQQGQMQGQMKGQMRGGNWNTSLNTNM